MAQLLYYSASPACCTARIFAAKPQLTNPTRQRGGTLQTAVNLTHLEAIALADASG